MRERQGWLLAPTFQRAVKVVARSDRLTSDGGAILLRDADRRLGLFESLAARLCDPRRQDRIRYTLLELLRLRLYALALGYSALDDLAPVPRPGPEARPLLAATENRPPRSRSAVSRRSRG